MYGNRKQRHTAPERIRLWCERNYAPHWVERMFDDLLDVATGNREGNRFERQALDRIFPENVKESRNE